MITAPFTASAQIQWNYLTGNDPLDRAYYTGRAAVGGIQDPVTLLHLHSLWTTTNPQLFSAHLRLQTESSNSSTPNAFGRSEIQFFSAKYNGPGQATNQWCAGLIASVANGGGKSIVSPWGQTGEFINTDAFNNNEFLDTRGGLAFYSSIQPNADALPNESSQSEVMRIVNRKMSVGLMTDNIKNLDNTSWLGLNEPRARLHVVDHIAVGIADGNSESNPALQGKITLLPGNSGIWYHLRNTGSYLDILDGGTMDDVYTGTGAIQLPAANAGAEIARFLGWAKSMTVGSGIGPNATLHVTAKPFYLNPDWGIQNTAFRVQRAGTAETGIPDAIKNDRNYKLISAGHESEETFLVYGSGRVKITGTNTTSLLDIQAPMTTNRISVFRVLDNAGTTEQFRISHDGYVMAQEFKVALTNTGDWTWPDYVLKKEYNLMPLSEVEEYINANGHLPGVPSAKQVEESGGVELGKIQAKLLEKIEELTLHIIRLEKELNHMKAKPEQQTAGEVR